jgi:hypothetical protein
MPNLIEVLAPDHLQRRALYERIDEGLQAVRRILIRDFRIAPCWNT